MLHFITAFYGKIIQIFNFSLPDRFYNWENLLKELTLLVDQVCGCLCVGKCVLSVGRCLVVSW